MPISPQNLFAPFYTRFLVRTDDMRQVKQDKIKLLLNVITIDTYPAILRELIVRALPLYSRTRRSDLSSSLGLRRRRGRPRCLRRCPRHREMRAPHPRVRPAVPLRAHRHDQNRAW